MLGFVMAGIAPGVALLSYFYLKDNYGTEPISFVSKTFILGALLVFPVMFIQYVLEAENIVFEPLLESFLIVAMLEESLKWIISFYVIMKYGDFDEPYDGVVYGAAVSLGFASAENSLYLLANGMEVAVGRAILPVSGHGLFGIIMGYYLGKGKFTKQSRTSWIMPSLLVPILLHGSYSFILTGKENINLLIFPFMLILWWFGLKKIKMAKLLSARHFN